MPPKKPLRILHVHSDLQWGGVERWLLQVSRSIDRSAFQFDFFAASVDPAWHSAMESMRLGLIPSPRPRRLWSYAASLRRVLESGPGYDVIHSHFIDHSGVVLREANRARVPLRIAHSHIDVGPILRGMDPIRRAYFLVQNRLLRRYATTGLAASSAAAASMFGRTWAGDRRWSVLHCGVDLTPFDQPSQHIRSELGFAPDDIVFGHVGRFAEQKNHRFLIDVALQLSSMVPRARFLWIGEGPLQNAIEERLRATGLRDRVKILSRCENVPGLMQGAMDAFLFPSLFEGLGLAVVEAQAAGLPCFISDRVPFEADAVPELVHRFSLSDSADNWASAIACGLRPAVKSWQALDAVRSSSFNIETSARRLEEVYRGQR
ncbi:MAG: glycosyltransferase [Bryobacteraceae bacterium]|jgi:glycosyltransferase involved in cell wall biosynthesis